MIHSEVLPAALVSVVEGATDEELRNCRADLMRLDSQHIDQEKAVSSGSAAGWDPRFIEWYYPLIQQFAGDLVVVVPKWKDRHVDGFSAPPHSGEASVASRGSANRLWDRVAAVIFALWTLGLGLASSPKVADDMGDSRTIFLLAIPIFGAIQLFASRRSGYWTTFLWCGLMTWAWASTAGANPHLLCAGLPFAALSLFGLWRLWPSRQSRSSEEGRSRNLDLGRHVTIGATTLAVSMMAAYGVVQLSRFLVQ
ncbi:MAG TPA: hypothetical protein VMI31_16305 [Fimbriimonadaceae bacterium]|nr:hypothetical protein [Fimbriimonadaceae bacterium]